MTDAGGVTPDEDTFGKETALALSGGGHRATLFGLGALLALADTQASDHVSSIASVSGGSIANGAIAARVDYRDDGGNVAAQVAAIARKVAAGPAVGPGVWQKLILLLIVALALATCVGPWFVSPGDLGLHSAWVDRHTDLARIIVVAVGALLVGGLLRTCITGGGTLFGWWGTWAYFALLLALAEAVYSGIPRLHDGPRVLLYVAGTLLVLAGFGLRGRVTAHAFAHTLFPRRAKTTLASVNRAVNHVICATDMHAGEHVYFSPRFVYAYRFGRGNPANMRLHTAVQASAAFPGAFPVTWVRRRPFGFRRVGQGDSASEDHTPPFLSLVDGGVYDNMGDEWPQGLSHRPGGPYEPAEALIVVNASRGMPYGRVWPLALPLVGWALAFLREKSVLYDSGTAQRRRAMIRQFDLAALKGTGMRGALVHIATDPYDALTRVKDLGGPWAARAQRAQDALGFLDTYGSRAHDDWRSVADANAAVATTLVGLDRETSARLLHHAYILTAINSHVFLRHPLPDPGRTLDDFVEMLER